MYNYLPDVKQCRISLCYVQYLCILIFVYLHDCNTNIWRCHYLYIVRSVVPLTVVSRPENVTVNASGHAYFNTSFAGTDIVNINWFSPSGSLIGSMPPDIVVSSIIYPTEALSLLNFSNIQRNQSEGWYRCVCFALNGSDYTYVEVNIFVFVQGTVHVQYHDHSCESQDTRYCVMQSQDTR